MDFKVTQSMENALFYTDNQNKSKGTEKDLPWKNFNEELRPK